MSNLVIPNIVVTSEGQQQPQSSEPHISFKTQAQMTNKIKTMKNINSDSSITFLDQQMLNSDAKLFYDQQNSQQSIRDFRHVHESNTSHITSAQIFNVRNETESQKCKFHAQRLDH